MTTKRQYLEALRDDIATGRLAKEKRLPSFRELALRYDCSIASIKLAVDTLQEEGLLETIHGKGTFFTDRGPLPLPRQERRRIIGAILLRNGWLETMDAIKMEYQKCGWFLSVYDACVDMQNPAKEREFLEMALCEGFAGMLMVATPIHPVNTEFFREMRRKGMKIAHLAYYQEDMSHENCFLLDYAAAVDMALERAKACGFDKILPIWDGSRGPAQELMAKRLSAKKSPVELLDTFHCQSQLAEWESSQPYVDNVRRRETMLEEFLPLYEVGRDTLLLCNRAETASKLLEVMALAGECPPVIWALDALTPRNAGVEAVRYNLRGQINEAMNYLCDRTIDPLQPMRKVFKPMGFGLNNNI